MRILITGSTGKLGSALLEQLKDTPYEVRATSRSKPIDLGNFEWVYSDLVTGKGLEEAVRDIDVIIHAATSPMKNSEAVEVAGFREFLSKIQHVKHFIYPSIVGIDEIPYKYYQLKYEAEKLLKDRHLPHTIVRASQFHHFVEELFLTKTFLKRYIIPGSFKCQSVDVHEFAKHLLDLIEKEPQGRVADFGGPEILTLREMAELKIKLFNETNKIVSVTVPGKLFKAFSAGKNTSPLHKEGTVGFEHYLTNK